MPHADIKLWELCCPFGDVVLHPDAHPGGLGLGLGPGAAVLAVPLAPAAHQQLPQLSPEVGELLLLQLGLVGDLLLSALQLPAVRHRQPRVIHLAHCHLHGLKAGLLLHLLELWTIYRKNVNIGSFWWWFFRSLGQSHTFLFFSCETLSPNPKLAQVLDFFLLEQRIVSTGEKFYSKYLFESQIMIYIT